MARMRAFPSIRLLRPLASVLGAGLLVASSSQAALLTQKIGYDSMVNGDIGQDLSLRGAFYVPFAFTFDGGLYSLASVQLFLVGTGDASTVSLLVTSTLGADLTVPPILTTLSASGVVNTAEAFTFQSDSPSILTSGSTYYLRMSTDIAEIGGDPQWVSGLTLSGSPPADDGNPTMSGPPTSGPGGPSVILQPLMTLNPGGGVTFRMISSIGYTDKQGPYGISITAYAVPEPTAFSLVTGGLTLGAALFFRLRRRR